MLFLGTQQLLGCCFTHRLREPLASEAVLCSQKSIVYRLTCQCHGCGISLLRRIHNLDNEISHKSDGSHTELFRLRPTEKISSSRWIAHTSRRRRLRETMTFFFAPFRKNFTFHSKQPTRSFTTTFYHKANTHDNRTPIATGSKTRP